MCYGMGMVAVENGDIFWIEADSDGNVSHHKILSRGNMIDDESKIVKIEFPEWTAQSFRFDNLRMPEWAVETSESIKAKALRIFKRINMLPKQGLIQEEKVKQYTGLPGYLPPVPKKYLVKKFFADVKPVRFLLETGDKGHVDTCTESMKELSGTRIEFKEGITENWVTGEDWLWHISWLENFSIQPEWEER